MDRPNWPLWWLSVARSGGVAGKEGLCSANNFTWPGRGGRMPAFCIPANASPAQQHGCWRLFACNTISNYGGSGSCCRVKVAQLLGQCIVEPSPRLVKAKAQLPGPLNDSSGSSQVFVNLIRSAIAPEPGGNASALVHRPGGELTGNVRHRMACRPLNRSQRPATLR